eukprot:Platyproteum_vivax@DN1381_c0_g1_i1.p1
MPEESLVQEGDAVKETEETEETEETQEGLVVQGPPGSKHPDGKEVELDTWEEIGEFVRQEELWMALLARICMKSSELSAVEVVMVFDACVQAHFYHQAVLRGLFIFLMQRLHGLDAADVVPLLRILREMSQLAENPPPVKPPKGKVADVYRKQLHPINIVVTNKPVRPLDPMRYDRAALFDLVAVIPEEVNSRAYAFTNEMLAEVDLELQKFPNLYKPDSIKSIRLRRSTFQTEMPDKRPYP